MDFGVNCNFKEFFFSLDCGLNMDSGDSEWNWKFGIKLLFKIESSVICLSVMDMDCGLSISISIWLSISILFRLLIDVEVEVSVTFDWLFDCMFVWLFVCMFVWLFDSINWLIGLQNLSKYSNFK